MPNTPKETIEDLSKEFETLKTDENYDELKKLLEERLPNATNKSPLKKYELVNKIVNFLLRNNRKPHSTFIKIYEQAITDLGIEKNQSTTPRKSNSGKATISTVTDEIRRILDSLDQDATSNNEDQSICAAYKALQFRYSKQPFRTRLKFAEGAITLGDLTVLTYLQDLPESHFGFAKLNHVEASQDDKTQPSRKLEIYTKKITEYLEDPNNLNQIAYAATLAKKLRAISNHTADRAILKEKLNESFKLLIEHKTIIPSNLSLAVWKYAKKHDCLEALIPTLIQQNNLPAYPVEYQIELTSNLAVYYEEHYMSDAALNFYRKLNDLKPNDSNALNKIASLTKKTHHIQSSDDNTLESPDIDNIVIHLENNHLETPENYKDFINSLIMLYHRLANTHRKNETLKGYIEKLKTRCKNTDDSPKNILELTLLILFTTKIGVGKPKREIKKFYHFHKTQNINELEILKKKVRKKYDALLNKSDCPQSIKEFAGWLFAKGIIFSKDHYIARKLLEQITFEELDTKNQLYYAKLLITGKAGSKNIKECQTILEKITQQDIAPNTTKAKAYYYLGKIALIDQQDTAIKHFKEAIQLGNRKSINVLYFLHQKNNLLATRALYELFFKEATLDNSPLSNISFPGLTCEFKYLYIYFKQIVEPLTDEETQKLNEIQLKNKNIATKKVVLKIKKIEAALVSNAKFRLSKKLIDAPEQALSLGINLLDKKKDPRILLYCLESDDTSVQQNAKKTLLTYFYQNPNILLSTVYYEYIRSGENEQASLVITLREMLKSIDPTTQHLSISKLKSQLEEKEKTHKTFFDPCPSDDSDDEQDNYRKKSRDHLKAKEESVSSLRKRMPITEFKNKIDEYNKKTEEELNVKTELEKIKMLFSKCKPEYPPLPRTERAIEDLEALNACSLENALPLITTNFVTAQARGLHLKPTIWSKRMREKFRKPTKEQENIYSHAAYSYAGISDFTDKSPHYNIHIASYIIEHRLEKLHSLPPHEPIDNPDPEFIELNKFFEKTTFQTRAHQIQELYTKNYDLFHIYLKWETQQENSIFLNDKNPFNSTGDSPYHSFLYAYGVKPYAGHEHERLFVNYDSNGKPFHPHSGIVYLTIHPLHDLTDEKSQHIVSMNKLGLIEIPAVILPERETTFYAHIPGKRVLKKYVAKYPSFEGDYKDIHKFEYGLEKTEYDALKKLITDHPPHSKHHQLAVALLGHFLAAYNYLFLTQEAERHTKANKQVLVYKNIYGKFSERPPEIISAHPNGDAHHKRKIRAFPTLFKPGIKPEENTHAGQKRRSDTDQDPKRVHVETVVSSQ